jgi:peptidoglycan/LPS O-acetylase OafA/YrhL
MRAELLTNRLTHLDGLRGLAALSVAFGHFFAAFDPSLQFGSNFSQMQNWQTEFAASPGFLLINGSFSVYVFMVLSGYVISGASEQNATPILKLIFARFFRLHIPAACAIGIAMILFESNALNLYLVHPLFDHWWIKLYYNPAALLFVKQYGDLLGRYIFTGSSDYIPPLWTMQTEFYASCACFVFFRCLKQRHYRLAVLPVLALLILFAIPPDHASLYLAFVIGALLWELKPHRSLPQWVPVAVLAIGCLLGGMSQFRKPDHSFYPFLLGSYAELLRINILLVWTGAAALIVLAAISSPAFQTLLRSQICQFLGRISFSLYLIHFPILGSLASTLFLHFGQNSAFGLCIVLAVYLAAVLIVATIFETLVDRNAVAVSRWVRNPSSEKSQPKKKISQC